jgi:hypothetical protein
MSFVGVGIVAMVATGCESEPPANLSVTIEADLLVVANCGVRAPGEVQVRMGEEVESQFDDFFVGVLEDGWDVGDVLSASSERWSTVEVDETPSLTPGGRLTITYYGADAGGRVAYFTLPQRGVPEHAWLHPDGTITPSMCGD